MATYFPRGEQPRGDDLVMWAQDHFGRHAGYANQLLFQEQRTLDAPHPENLREKKRPASATPRQLSDIDWAIAEYTPLCLVMTPYNLLATPSRSILRSPGILACLSVLLFGHPEPDVRNLLLPGVGACTVSPWRPWPPAPSHTECHSRPPRQINPAVRVSLRPR